MRTHDAAFRGRRSVSWGVAAVLVAAGVLLAFLGNARLIRYPPLPGHYPYVLTAAELADNAGATGKRVAVLGDGLRLYENVTFGFDAEIPATDCTPLFLVARGRPSQGIYPRISLKVDHRFVCGLSIGSDDWGLYRMFLPPGAGRRYIELAYVNDGFAYPADRDLDLLVCSIGVAPPAGSDLHRWKAPCTIAPDRMAIRDYARPCDAGVLIEPNGRLGDDVYVEAGNVAPVMLAVSFQAQAVQPVRLKVLFDGVTVTNFDAGSPGTVGASAAIGCGAGIHSLALVNASVGVDSDILIRDIRFGAGASASITAPAETLLSNETVQVSGVAFRYHQGGTLHADGAWTLWNNGYLAHGVTCTDARDWRISVAARGELCEGVGPRMTLVVDRDQLARWEVRESVFRDYSVPVRLSAGHHELYLVFDNDRTVPGQGDRNLCIRGLSLVVPGVADVSTDRAVQVTR